MPDRTNRHDGSKNVLPKRGAQPLDLTRDHCNHTLSVTSSRRASSSASYLAFRVREAIPVRAREKQSLIRRLNRYIMIRNLCLNPPDRESELVGGEHYIRKLLALLTSSPILLVSSCQDEETMSEVHVVLANVKRLRHGNSSHQPTSNRSGTAHRCQEGGW